MKQKSQQVFLDFHHVPKNSPRRKQEGVYHSEIFGAPGKRVQIVLLDTRYFRTPFGREKPYVPNTDPGATVLGEMQWRWLEQQLRQPAELRVIASSIQVVSEHHGAEKWMNFPNERTRLYNLLKSTKAAGVVFLSGDRHFADLSMMDAGIGYPIYDLTSSGLTQGFDKWRPLPANPHRVAGMSFDDHFGLIAIDWNKPDPMISLQIRDVAGEIRINQKMNREASRKQIPISWPTGNRFAPVSRPAGERGVCHHQGRQWQSSDGERPGNFRRSKPLFPNVCVNRLHLSYLPSLRFISFVRTLMAFRDRLRIRRESLSLFLSLCSKHYKFAAIFSTT